MVQVISPEQSGSSGSVTISDVHGNIYAFGWALQQPSSPTAGYGSASLQYIEDSNGNRINNSPTRGGWNDTLGRNVYDYLSTPTTTETITTNFALGNYNFDQSGSQQLLCGAIVGGKASLTEVRSIGLPNQTAYTFEYDPTYGLISKIIYPSGGYVAYVWEDNPLSDSAWYTWSIQVNGGTNDTPPTFETGKCNEKYDWPAVQKRLVSFDGKTVALEQDFAYQKQWTTYQGTGQLVGSQTTVTTKDNISGTQYDTVYTYTPGPPEAVVPGA